MTEKNRIRGKKARAAGQRFELKVRKDLEKKGFVVDKWSNNIDLKAELIKEKYIGEDIKTGDKYHEKIYKGKLIQAKRKFNPFSKAMMLGAGFPDFIAFRIARGYMKEFYEVIGCECKTNGYLDKIEKEKCKWLLDNHIFGKILIASQDKYKDVTGKKRKKFLIKYREFEEKK